MKKMFFVAMAVSLTLASCSKKEEVNTDSNVMLEEPKTATPASPADTAAAATTATPAGTAAPAGDGKALIAAADCLSCHKEDTKLVGPAYQEVANKYENTDANVEMLATKVIEGGKGNWGDIPMTPHASISKDDAKNMVKYILSLKK